jgi:ribonuclease P protein component
MTPRLTFSKSEHLCGEKDISTLFSTGKSYLVYPFRMVYIEMSFVGIDRTNAQVLISVPKKRFKRAVKRNRIKRQIREAYRIHKHDFVTSLIQKEIRVHLAINYIADLELETDILKSKLKTALDKLLEKL